MKFLASGHQASTFQYQFSLLAPNEDMALVLAQENFMRREPVVDIWIVNRKHIRKMNAEEKMTLRQTGQ